MNDDVSGDAFVAIYSGADNGTHTIIVGDCGIRCAQPIYEIIIQGVHVFTTKHNTMIRRDIGLILFYEKIRKKINS